MSSFKPMVKMYTEEPKVTLKLKKGGKVNAKHHKEHEEHGHKAMHHAMGGMHHAFESEHGKAPKKPSMGARMKAMNPNMYAKGGKVAHKVMGGGMPVRGVDYTYGKGGDHDMPTSAPMGGMGGMGNMRPPMSPMGQSALGQMTPAQRAARAMMVRKALTGMKKGGSADHKMIEKLEKELHHHESMPMSKAHHKAHGGKVHHKSGHPEGSLEHHKAMCKHYEKMCNEGGSAHAHKMLKHHKEMCKGGKYAEGGKIDKDMTRTTIEGNAKKFAKTKMYDGEHHDKAHGTGEVKIGKPGGYATGGAIPSDTHESKNKAKTKMGGTLEGNEGDYVNTQMHSAKKDKAHGTGGVSMGNAGGFKRGGKAMHKADGGSIDKYETRNTVEGGNWENRAANTAKPGKKNTKTGEVKESNAGGYKHGGHASKKAYATGGNVNAMGKPVAMPKHFVSQPVANSLQSGTFKDGGEVSKKAKGGTSTWGGSTPLRLLKTHTGPKGHVAKVYKDVDYGEHRVKFFDPEGKHYKDADYHTDDKEDAHDTARGQLNRYQSGGKAKKFDDGGSANDKYIVKDPKAVSDKASRELEDAMNPTSMVKELYGKAKNYFSPPAGSITKTEKSVTVSPSKKRGGSAKC